MICIYSWLDCSPRIALEMDVRGNDYGLVRCGIKMNRNKDDGEISKRFNILMMYTRLNISVGMNRPLS